MTDPHFDFFRVVAVAFAREYEMPMANLQYALVGDWCFLIGLKVLSCLLYTFDAADERSCVDLGGARIIKKKTDTDNGGTRVINEERNEETRK